MYRRLFEGVLCWSLFWYSLLCPFKFCNYLDEEDRAGWSILLLSFRCLVTVNVLWLFLAWPWVGLQCVIVVFPEHTRLSFATYNF